MTQDALPKLDTAGASGEQSDIRASAGSQPESGAGERAPVVLPADGPVTHLLSVLCWIVGLAWLLIGTTALRLLYRVFEPDRIDFLTRLYTGGQAALTGSRITRVVHPDIKPDQPYIFMQNHVNLLDPHVMYHATPHFKQGLELHAHFSLPLYGPFVDARGTIPIKFGSIKHLRELRQAVQAEVDKGHSILIYPEGTRTTTGHVGDFQQGVFRIAQQIGIPLVPVTATGWYRVMRKGSSLIRPGHEVTVYFDEPIEVAGTTRKQLPEIMERVRTVMDGHLDEYWRRTSS